MSQAWSDAGMRDFSVLERRIEAWRRSRRGGEPMPEALWRAARELARVHGPTATARRLRLHYGRLKERLEGDDAGAPTAGAVAGGFVDLGPAGALFAGSPSSRSASVPEIVIEVVSAAGERLTIRLPADREVDVVGVVREARGQR